jgi:Flp pilus assembly protein TadB
MPLPPQEKPLSPYEEKVLATLEEELRVEDPALAATLSRTPQSSSTAAPFLPPIRHVLHLLAALTGLIAVVAFAGGHLGFLGLAAVTCAAVVPWLVRTARSAERRSRVEATSDAESARLAREPVTSAGAHYAPRAGTAFYSWPS